MSTTDSKAARPVINMGTRRLVVGPGPKSKGGDRKLIKFDTSADAAVEPSKRIGQTHTVPGAVIESKTFKAMGEKLGLKVG